MPYLSTQPLITDPRIKDEDIGAAVRHLSRFDPEIKGALKKVLRDAAVLAAMRENRENLEKSHAAG